MRLFLSIASLILAITTPASFVSGEVMIRFIFNDGRAPSVFDGTYCTSTENTLIDTVFDLKSLLGIRRQLRAPSANGASPTSSAKMTVPATSKTESRELYPRKCKNNCAGLATGTCRATDCVGYRRRELTDKRDGVDTDRDLQEAQCPALVELVHSKLDALSISSTCLKFLDKSKRVTTCLDDVIYGEIEGVRLWQVSFFRSTVLQERMPSSGYSFCKSTSFNLESINNDCVDNALMVLKGPNNYEYINHETSDDYTLFQDFGITMMGQKMTTPGVYTLSITPDGFEYKEKTFTFTVKNC